MMSLRRRLLLTLGLVLGVVFLVGLWLQWNEQQEVLMVRLQGESESLGEQVESELVGTFRQVEARARLVGDVNARLDRPLDLKLMGEGISGLERWSYRSAEGTVWECEKRAGKIRYRTYETSDSPPEGGARWHLKGLDSVQACAIYTTPAGDGAYLRFEILLGALLAELTPMRGSIYPFLVEGKGDCLCRSPGGKIAVGHLSSVPGDLLAVRERSLSAHVEDLKNPGQRGLLEGRDPIWGRPGWIAFSAIPQMGMAVGVFYPREVLGEQLGRMVGTLSLEAGLLLLGLFAVAYIVAARTSAPLETLTQAARSLARGQFDAPLGEASRIAEVEELRLAFLAMRQELGSYIADRETQSVLRARIQKELDVARQIQTSNLPESCSLLECPNYRVLGRSQPAREVGGDFLDAIALRNGKVAAFVGDVAGKGVPAALYTVLARNVIKARLLALDSPARVLEAANDLLVIDNPDSMFVTALVIVFDPMSGSYSYARAGHPAPIVWGPRGASEVEGSGAPPLGVMADFPYDEDSGLLAPGEALILYTDGVSEAENREGDMLGEERLMEAMQGPPCALALDKIFSVVEGFRDGAEPNDDTTALVLVRLA